MAAPGRAWCWLGALHRTGLTMAPRCSRRNRHLHEWRTIHGTTIGQRSRNTNTNHISADQWSRARSFQPAAQNRASWTDASVTTKKGSLPRRRQYARRRGRGLRMVTRSGRQESEEWLNCSSEETRAFDAPHSLRRPEVCVRTVDGGQTFQLQDPMAHHRRVLVLVVLISLPAHQPMRITRRCSARGLRPCCRRRFSWPHKCSTGGRQGCLRVTRDDDRLQRRLRR